MGFFDNVKKVFGSKKKDVDSQNCVKEELIDDSTFSESIKNNNGNFNDNEEIQSNNLEEPPTNKEVIHKPTPIKKIRNFKYFDNLIHSGAKEIVLDSDIVLSDNEESEYLEGIKLDFDNLIIDGKGFTVDASEKTRIFLCTGKNITIKNIILKNGFTETITGLIPTNGGGAVYNRKGELTIIDSTLNGNRAQGEFGINGGAIFNFKGKLSIIQSKLNNNLAKDGGAIYSEGELNIVSSILDNNNATSKGGAIYSEGELSIVSSSLDNNKAQDGGAILNNYRSNLTMVGCNLNNNEAKMNGGSICIYKGGKANISESTLNNNKAISGGSISNRDGELNISESTLNNNEANTGGGAVDSQGKLTISDHTFINGNVSNRAGAIDNSGEANISNSTLNNNISNTKYLGAGAIVNSGVMDISESLFNSNKGESSVGAIANIRVLNIFNCEISNNVSPNKIILNEDTLEIYNTAFKDNQSKYIVLNNRDMANLGIFYGEFKKNNVKESVLCNDGKFCIVEKTVFQNNISNNKMNIINNCELTLNNPKIKDKGKSILNQKYILIKKSPPELENKIYGDGTVEVDERIIPQGESFDFAYLDDIIQQRKYILYMDKAFIKLNEDIHLENYERDFYEGGIDLDIDNLIIDGDGHTIDGAGKSRIFIITGKNITLKNIIFKNGCTHKNYHNQINTNGGAIKINSANYITIENCEFINNASAGKGGVIYNSNNILTIKKSLLKNNSAKDYGGAINNKWGEISIIETALTGNMVQEYGGGAISNYCGEITINRSKLQENTAHNGGAINNYDGEITISESTLNNNTANWKGGAINNNGSLTITESTLTGNTAQAWYDGGGAIYNDKGELNISKSTFTENKASDGGAIWSYKGDLNILESIFTENISKGKYPHGKGGAINIDNGKLKISKSKLNNNYARGRGAAIYNVNGKLDISDSTFNENAGLDQGTVEVVYNEKGQLTITGCKLKNNEDYVIHNTDGRLKVIDSTLYNNKHNIFNFNEIEYKIENCKIIDSKDYLQC